MAGRSDIEAGRAFIRLYMKNQEFQSGLRQAKKLLADFADAVKNLGRSMIGLSLGGLIPASMSVKKFVDFDDALRQIKASTRSSVADMNRLGEEALDLSVALGYTGTEVANLMLVLARGGFKIDGIEDATRAVLTMARATGTNAVISANILMKTLNQFGMSTDHAATLADKLTLAANRSTIDIENLGDSLKYSASVGRAFEVSIDEVLAMTSGLGNLGIEGEMAGTSLRRLMMLITTNNADLMTNFGVSAVDTAENMRPLIDVFHDIHTVLSKSSIPAMARKLDKAFALLGVTPAIGIGRTAVSIKELYNEIKTAKGVAEEAATFIQGGLGGAFRVMISLVDKLAIRIGKALSDEIESVLDIAHKLSTTIIKFVEDNKELVVMLAKVSLAIGGVGVALLALGTAIRFAEYGLTGFLVMSSVILAPLSLFTGELMRAWMGARLFGRGVTQFIGNMVAKVDLHLTRLSKTLISFGDVLLRVIGGGAVAAFRSLPSIASSALGGMRTAFLSTAQAARAFWQGLSGHGTGRLRGIMMNFGGLGASIRNLGVVIRANGPALMKFFGLFTTALVAHLTGVPYHTVKATLSMKYFFLALFGAQRTHSFLASLSKIEKRMWMFGATLNYSARRSAQTVGYFFKALSGQYFNLATLNRVERAFWMAGAYINYYTRRSLTALRTFGGRIHTIMVVPVLNGVQALYRALGSSRLVAALATISTSARMHMTTFWTALSGKSFHKPIATFTWLEQQLWWLGSQVNYHYVRPFIAGFRAIAAVGRQSFLTLGTAAVLTAKLTVMAWRAVGPRIAAGLIATIGGAFKAIKAISMGATRGLLRGVSSGISGIAMSFGMIASYGTGAIATAGAFAMTLSMIIPSVLGLLNPMTLLTGLLVGGTIGWLKYTESGKAMVTSLTPIFKKFAGSGKLIFDSMKDAFESGDLGLAGQIALSGLKLVFLQGINSIIGAIDPVWGEAIGTLATQVTEGDFAGAWSTSLIMMTTGWSTFTVGMIKLYVHAMDEILAAHKRMQESLGNWIAEAAQGGGGEFAGEDPGSAWARGLDALINIGNTGEGSTGAANRARKLEMQRQAGMGAGSAPNLPAGLAGTGAGAGGPDLLDKSAAIVTDVLNHLDPEYLKKNVIPGMEEKAAADKATLSTTTAGGAGLADLAEQDALKEIADLRLKAHAMAETVRKKRLLELNPPPDTNPPPGGGEADLGQDTRAGTATFSAYAAQATNRADVVGKLDEVVKELKEVKLLYIRQGELNKLGTQKFDEFLNGLKYT